MFTLTPFRRRMLTFLPSEMTCRRRHNALSSRAFAISHGVQTLTMKHGKCSVLQKEEASPPLFASHTKQQFCRSHKAMRSLKLAQCLSHLSQQLLLLSFCELPHHISGQPDCGRLQERIERSAMGLKGKSTGDDLGKSPLL
jgi:hypothetical protein